MVSGVSYIYSGIVFEYGDVERLIWRLCVDAYPFGGPWLEGSSSSAPLVRLWDDLGCYRANDMKMYRVDRNKEAETGDVFLKLNLLRLRRNLRFLVYHTSHTFTCYTLLWRWKRRRNTYIFFTLPWALQLGVYGNQGRRWFRRSWFWSLLML